MEAKPAGKPLAGLEAQSAKYAAGSARGRPTTRAIEASIRDNRPRVLAQMATGSGKTFMPANLTYRLATTSDAERVLFLVDRANLGRQTLREFQQFATPGDGRKFTELYNVQLLTTNRIDPAARVVLTTVQPLLDVARVGRAGRGPREQSGELVAPELPVEVEYNPTARSRRSTW